MNRSYLGLTSRAAHGADLANRIRRRVLELSYAAHVGHIGSCLSIADLLATVYTAPWFVHDPDSDDRDRFVLGKGHAGLALFAALEAKGCWPAGHLDSFCSDGSEFGVHPERTVRGVDFSTGSLGHGLGIAVGAALAARIQDSDRRVVALLSDAECNAGSTWEAAHFAGQHQLPNLLTIVDVNGQQALGSTRDILDQEPFDKRWRNAGWEVRETDGHDHSVLSRVIEPSSTGPVAVVARTVFGAGVPFMERQLDWHYLPMSAEQYSEALASLARRHAS
jgi:transketolase